MHSQEEASKPLEFESAHGATHVISKETYFL